MKKPKPIPPSNLPAGTVQFGGPIEWFSIGLRISTEEITPERISELLGCAPTHAQRLGDPILRADGSVLRLAKFSLWRLKLTPEETDEWDVCEAAKLLLAQVRPDVNVWRGIGLGAEMSLSFGLSMESSNNGFSLDVELLGFLADRGIELDVDVYAEEFDLPRKQQPTAH